MDPINPIEPRSRWISELTPADSQSDRSKSARHERRKASRAADRGTEPPRAPTREQDDPDEEGTEGRRIDVRA
jgi:hypothetical protein